MNAAKGAWWANYLDVQGNKHSFTLLQEDAQSDKDFILRVKQFEVDLAASGFSWSGIVKDGASYKREQNGSDGDLSGAVKSELKSIPVESIEFVGKERWLVKGGIYKKFGVSAFKEVLERAGLLDKLSVDRVNNPTGAWVAFYHEERGDDGKTKPGKIVSIERG